MHWHVYCILSSYVCIECVCVCCSDWCLDWRRHLESEHREKANLSLVWMKGNTSMPPCFAVDGLNYLKGTPNTLFLHIYFHLSFFHSIHPFYPDLSLFYVIFVLVLPPQGTSRYLTLSHSVLWGSWSCPRPRRPECSQGPSAQCPMKNTSVARGDRAQ